MTSTNTLGNLWDGQTLTNTKTLGEQWDELQEEIKELQAQQATNNATKQAIQDNDSLPCTDFNAQNHYRIIATTDRMYDSVAVMFSPFGGVHMGHVLLMENDPTMFGYPGFNPTPSFRLPLNFIAHLPWFYSGRIERIMERGCFPVPVGKWLKGHWCNYDDECVSNDCFLFNCR